MEVTLQQLLDAKEQRAARQKQLALQYNATVVSFTVMAVGSNKNTLLTTKVAGEGERVLKAAFAQQILHSERYEEATGFYLLLAVSGDSTTIKRQAVQIEQTHLLGRLFDIDVIHDGIPISRTQIGAPPRQCLLCGKPAAVCVRQKTHSIQELQQKIQQIANGFEENNV